MFRSPQQKLSAENGLWAAKPICRSVASDDLLIVPSLCQNRRKLGTFGQFNHRGEYGVTLILDSSVSTSTCRPFPQAKDVLAEIDTKDAGSLVASAFKARSHRKKQQGDDGPPPEPSRRSLRVTPGANYNETFLCLPDDFDDCRLGKVRNLSLEVSKMGAEVRDRCKMLLRFE